MTGTRRDSRRCLALSFKLSSRGDHDGRRGRIDRYFHPAPRGFSGWITAACVSMKTIPCLFFFCFVFFSGGCLAPAAPTEPGLLFYLSGDHQFIADYAAGDPKPTFLRDVRLVPDGARGPGFE